MCLYMHQGIVYSIWYRASTVVLQLVSYTGCNKGNSRSAADLPYASLPVPSDMLTVFSMNSEHATPTLAVLSPSFRPRGLRQGSQPPARDEPWPWFLPMDY